MRGALYVTRYGFAMGEGGITRKNDQNPITKIIMVCRRGLMKMNVSASESPGPGLGGRVRVSGGFL